MNARRSFTFAVAALLLAGLPARSLAQGYAGVSVNIVPVPLPGGSFGALVTGVNPFSPAHRAGLLPGDVVTAVNGGPVGGPAELIRTIKASRPGDRMNLAVVRNGMPLRGVLILGDPRPALRLRLTQLRIAEATSLRILTIRRTPVSTSSAVGAALAIRQVGDYHVEMARLRNIRDQIAEIESQLASLP